MSVIPLKADIHRRGLHVRLVPEADVARIPVGRRALEVTYWLPRPGTDKPLEKTSFYTKTSDQICGVGYYK
jgi:hypothetical protein